MLRKPFSLPRPERREAEVRKGEGSKVVFICGGVWAYRRRRRSAWRR